jgi:hypothetical protein
MRIILIWAEAVWNFMPSCTAANLPFTTLYAHLQNWQDATGDNRAIMARFVPTPGGTGDLAEALSLYASHNKLFSPRSVTLALRAKF